MKRILVFLSAVAFALAPALPAAAQMAPRSVTELITVKPKSGMSQQFEEGIKKLRQWQHQQNYPFVQHAWSVITGDQGGEYVFATVGRDWKDFDETEKFGPAISKEINADVAPYTELVVFSFWEAHPDLSANPPQAGEAPPKFISVATYSLKPGGFDTIESVIKQANEAIKKTNWPAKHDEWYTLINGGEGPQLTAVTWHNDWADFQPPEPSFGKMLSNVFGKAGSDALYHQFLKSVRTWRTEICRYRPELSYTPNSK
jgi:hypothetical protein